MAHDIIMLANEFDKQSAKWRRGRTLADLAHTHIGQPKFDGCHLIVSTGNGSAGTAWSCSRTDEWVRSVEHIEQALLKLAGPGFVFQGEAWIPGASFPEISGAYRRHLPQPQLEYVVYDWHRKAAFDDGVATTPYRERLEGLQALFRGYTGHPLRLVSSFLPGTYGDPLQNARDYVAKGGFDGFILRDPHAGWSVGRSKVGELVKVKPTLSLDLVVAAVTVDTGAKTGRNVYTLSVDYKGIISSVGSGVPHSAIDVPRPGMIAEIECMGITADGKLREPRFKAIRFDKKEPDA